MQTYLSGGGRLFVSGSELAWDMDRDTDQGDANSLFMQNYLKGDYVDDDVYTADTRVNTVNGAAGSIFNGLSGITFDNGNDGIHNVGYPDVINASGGSTVAMTYTGSTEGTVNAAVQYTGADFRVVYLAFPFETIFPESSRNTVMQRSLDYLLGASVPYSPV